MGGMPKKHQDAPREATDPALGPPLLYRVNQAAELLQLGRSTVERLVASGELRSIKVGKCRRIPADALAEFVQGAA